MSCLSTISSGAITVNLLPWRVASKFHLKPGLKFNASQEMTSTLYSPVDTVSDAMMTEAGESMTSKQPWK